MSEQLTDEQLVEAAIGAVDNVKHGATDEEIAAAIAEIREAGRAGIAKRA